MNNSIFTKSILTKHILYVFCLMTIFLTVTFFSNVNKAFAQVKIISPIANDSIFVGKDIEIIWESSNQPINLSYSTDNGINWHLISSNIAQSTYILTIPYISTKDIKLKIETDVFSDEVVLQAYYQYILEISDVAVEINQVANINLAFIPDFDVSKIPFSEVQLTAYISYPRKLLKNYPTDLMTTKLEEKAINFEDIYSHSIKNILNPTIYTVKAKTLVSDIDSASIKLKEYYSNNTNEMIALKSKESSIKILADCEMHEGRKLFDKDFPAIEFIEENEMLFIDFDVISDDLHTFVITDIQGAVILKKTYSNIGRYTIEINKSKLATGVYLAKLHTNYISSSAKFIIK